MYRKEAPWQGGGGGDYEMYTVHVHHQVHIQIMFLQKIVHL